MTSPSRPSKLSLAALSARLDDGKLRLLAEVRKLADEAGLRGYLVGGPVRDALLGEPVADLDFSIEGDAVEFGQELAGRLGGTCTTHHRFGTATVLAGDERVDLVTARQERYPAPGRLPEVTASAISEDLDRRDFSINAMALPLVEHEELIDPHGGIEDLRKKTVRILHRRSFVDDPTRMLRAVRYEQRFGFRIDDASLGCMKSALTEGHANAVSGDRWRHEIERTLEESDPGASLLRAWELGILAGIHPALEKGDGLRTLSSWDGSAPAAVEWLASMFAPLTTIEAEDVV